VANDVFVIGAGPAGIAAAIAARQKGFRVTVADGQQPPIDKACGEGLMPEALEALGELGVELPCADAFPLRGVRFVGAGAAVEAPFPGGAGAGVRRTTLHQALVEEAEARGVEFRWNSPVSGDSIHKIDADWIVGADGASSHVRAWAGLDGCVSDTWRFGFRRHYQIAPWSDQIEIYWGDGVEVYATPVAPDEVGIAVLSSDPKLRVDDALPEFPELEERLREAPHSSVERGAITATRKLREVARGNIALVGDASGSVDAITADGLCLGFLEATALARAMERGDLTLYDKAHARLARRPRFMAELMLTMDGSPWVRERALAAMAAHPWLFGGLVAMHVGRLPAPQFAAVCAVLGWRMLTA